jgi:hypothetical protein
MRYLTVGEDGRNVFAPWLVPFHASCSSFCICIRSGDASIKTFNIEDKVFVANLEGHDDSVQAGCTVARLHMGWGGGVASAEMFR